MEHMTNVGNVKFIFNNYDSGGEEWSMLPENLADGDCSFLTVAGSNIIGDIELLTENSCVSGYQPRDCKHANITKVELRVRGGVVGGDEESIYIRPVFVDGDGDNHTVVIDGLWYISDWINITNDTNAPITWTFEDVANLDCDVEVVTLDDALFVVASCVEIRVSFNNCCNKFSIIGDSYTINLNVPQRGGAGNQINKELELFSFWSENFAVRDNNIDTQPLTLTGIETICCESGSDFPICFPMCFDDAYVNKFKQIWEMQDLHEEVEISGLGGCFDAIYIIQDFKLDTIPRAGKNTLSWKIQLEKVRDLD